MGGFVLPVSALLPITPQHNKPIEPYRQIPYYRSSLIHPLSLTPSDGTRDIPIFPSPKRVDICLCCLRTD